MKRTDDPVSLEGMLAEPGWDRGQTTATMAPATTRPMTGAGIRRRPRSDRPLFGILALAIGMVWLLEVTVVRLNGETVLSVLLMLLGLGLVATGRRGGRLWPLLLGVLLTIALVAGSTSFHLDIPTNGGFGNRLFTPASASDLQSTYEMTAGNLTLDLSQLGARAGGRTVTIRQGFGKVSILVPPDLPVDVQARVSFGTFTSPGAEHPRGGVGVREEYTHGDQTKPLEINVKDFAGSVAVMNPASPGPKPPPPTTPDNTTPEQPTLAGSKP
jgi:hypothetical protein